MDELDNLVSEYFPTVVHDSAREYLSDPSRRATFMGASNEVKGAIVELISKNDHHELLLGETGNQIRTLKSENGRLRSDNDELREKAYIDPLTGLMSRGAFGDTLSRLFGRIKRMREGSLSVLALDFNNFKRYNTDGLHVYGDHVLRSVADTLKEELRDSDFLGRVGGDEFMWMVLNGDSEGVGKLADRIARSVYDMEIKSPRELHEDVLGEEPRKKRFTKNVVQPSLSIGITTFYGGTYQIEDEDALCNLADEASEKAKKRFHGRKKERKRDGRELKPKSDICVRGPDGSTNLRRWQ